jgi:hypothetical protein
MAASKIGPQFLINPPLKPAPLRKLKFHGLSGISSIYSKNLKRLCRTEQRNTKQMLECFMYSGFEKGFTVSSTAA